MSIIVAMCRIRVLKREIEKMLSDEQGLSAINEIVFKIYLASITDNMIDLLCNEEVEIDDVVGIEDNE